MKKWVVLLTGAFLLISCSMFLPPDANGCDNDSLTPEEKANCGTNLYRTNAEIFGENCFFTDNQKTISEDVEYTFIYTEDEGFHQLWDYDTWMEISENNYSMTDTEGDNKYYSLYEFQKEGFIKTQRDINNCLIEFENILLGK